MAAVVYGGSPRHHSRMANTHHLHHSTALQQPTTHHYMQQSNATSPSQSSSKSNHLLSYSPHQPASYLATGTPMSSISQPLSLPHPQYAHQPAVQNQPHYHHSSAMYTTSRHPKRKSAVELLAESKPFYVKSETVLDRHQQLHFRSGTGNGGTASSGAVPNIGMERVCCVMSPQRTAQTHHQHQRPANRRSASSSSDLLQTKLRKLLNTDSNSREGLEVVPMPARYNSSRIEKQPKKFNTFSKVQGAKYCQELSVYPANDHGDVFPSAFLSPQSLPPHPDSDEDFFSYGIDEPLVLTENYRAISPPAEYAAVDSSPEKDPSVRCNYQRSYSHSHDTTSDEPDYSSQSYNINSHKSMPDLHSQISRHSPHSEVLSSCSRGNRSNKSGGGSSLNRDSGGSSGHYTHRSEPCCKQREPKITTTSDYRRDSGSSTQHSGNSYYTYGVSRYPDCPECRAKYQKDSECLLNFTTPEVPEAFQDDYPNADMKPHTRYYEEKGPSRKVYSHRQQPQPPTPEGKEPEISPPPSTFKRQRCMRYKHRTRFFATNDHSPGRCCEERDSEEDRKPILRSKSDISDRYWSRVASLTDPQAQTNKLPSGLDKNRKSESLSQLEKFFDRLGLNDEKFDEIYTVPKRRFSNDHDSDESSTVFFSDVSTVDSMRLPDSTETQPQTTQPYRPTEPPSIVERNARIIKWLCNCRKLQLI